MEFHLIPTIFALLIFLLARTTNALPAEQYWQLTLPNTSMPRFLQRLLQPGTKSPSLAETNFSTYKEFFNNNNRDKAAGQLGKHDFTNITTFFLHEHLRPHTKMWLHFPKSSRGPSFVPRQVADSIPFSVLKTTKILDHFSIKPDSVQAEMTKTTIHLCGYLNIYNGEGKHCATSLESLVDFSVAKIGKNVKVITTDIQEESKTQEYTIATEPKLVGKNMVLSHLLTYPYALFYSHWIGNNVNVYLVALVGSDGSRIKAVSICNTDTSTWKEGHIALYVLKVKPGVGICHFLDSDALVWIPK